MVRLIVLPNLANVFSVVMSGLGYFRARVSLV